MRLWHITLAVATLTLSAACNREPANGQSVADVTETPDAQATGAKVGDLGPALTVANAHNWDGDPPRLEDLRGKVVVLDFWAFW